MTISWKAVSAATEFYRDHVCRDPWTHAWVSYQAWMLEESGIDHGNDYIRIVDEDKYLLFLLRWA